jgi:hypothetical protein
VELSETLQEECLERLGVNLWAWRHIINIMKKCLQEIAPFFCRDNKASRGMFGKDVFYNDFFLGREFAQQRREHRVKSEPLVNTTHSIPGKHVNGMVHIGFLRDHYKLCGWERRST